MRILGEGLGEFKSEGYKLRGRIRDRVEVRVAFRVGSLGYISKNYGVNVWG